MEFVGDIDFVFLGVQGSFSIILNVFDIKLLDRHKRLQYCLTALERIVLFGVMC